MRSPKEIFPEEEVQKAQTNGRVPSSRESRPRTLLEQLHGRGAAGTPPQAAQAAQAAPTKRRVKSIDQRSEPAPGSAKKEMRDHPRNLPTPHSEPRRDGPKESC